MVDWIRCDGAGSQGNDRLITKVICNANSSKESNGGHWKEKQDKHKGRLPMRQEQEA